MDRTDTVQLILDIATTKNAFDRLERALSGRSKAQISQHLLNCGIIPEFFKHDSSEEKLWAKYCDIILAWSLNYLDIQTEVLRTRGDAADVFGRAPEYTIVGDAKAFRLSRTAKNQKDFKVSALDAWRRENTFACLVAPLYQYPARHSQIYEQAKQRNVTLLSYVHLKFLLDNRPARSLASLWQVGRGLSPSRDAQEYWQTIDSTIIQLTDTRHDQLRSYKLREIEWTKEIGEEGIAHWESVIRSYHSLSQEEAVQRLIRAEKITEKIRTIRAVMSKEPPV